MVSSVEPMVPLMRPSPLLRLRPVGNPVALLVMVPCVGADELMAESGWRSREHRAKNGFVAPCPTALKTLERTCFAAKAGARCRQIHGEPSLHVANYSEKHRQKIANWSPPKPGDFAISLEETWELSVPSRVHSGTATLGCPSTVTDTL